MGPESVLFKVDYESPCFDVLVNTYEEADTKLLEALDGEGDRILTAIDTLDLNEKVIDLIISALKEQNSTSVEELYEKVTGKSLGVKEGM